ncbi:hypothetical protein BD779DRAFT_1471222 [Infundibulicybe gibba]|nr:hypothetical protein BD779DRAFT_1471222 [Infundibulicybe gibba]
MSEPQWVKNVLRDTHKYTALLNGKAPDPEVASWMEAVNCMMERGSETSSSTLGTLHSVRATCAEPGGLYGKEKAPSAEDEDNDEESEDSEEWSEDDGEGSKDGEEGSKAHQPPRSVGHPQRGVKRSRANSAPASPGADLVAMSKRRKILNDSKPEPKTASVSEDTQPPGKGKNAKGNQNAPMTALDLMSFWEPGASARQKGGSGAATVGKPADGGMRGGGVLDGSACGRDSGDRKADDTETQGSKSELPRLTKATLSQCANPIPGPSQPPKNIQALDQITGSERSPAEIAAELTLTRDAISRHRAQIRLASMQLSHLEILEKELCAEMDKHSRGY